ncbi:Uncharacterised protein g11058 [Pycnogonum litorale]
MLVISTNFMISVQTGVSSTNDANISPCSLYKSGMKQPTIKVNKYENEPITLKCERCDEGLGSDSSTGRKLNVPWYMNKMDEKFVEIESKTTDGVVINRDNDLYVEWAKLQHSGLYFCSPKADSKALKVIYEVEVRKKEFRDVVNQKYSGNADEFVNFKETQIKLINKRLEKGFYPGLLARDWYASIEWSKWGPCGTDGCDSPGIRVRIGMCVLKRRRHVVDVNVPCTSYRAKRIPALYHKFQHVAEPYDQVFFILKEKCQIACTTMGNIFTVFLHTSIVCFRYEHLYQ